MLVQMGLTDIYRTFYPTTAECTFFSSAHGIFSRVNHMLSHKTSLHKCKVEIISTIFSNHNDGKLEIKYKNKTQKFTNMWSLNNILLNN